MEKKVVYVIEDCPFGEISKDVNYKIRYVTQISFKKFENVKV